MQKEVVIQLKDVREKVLKNVIPAVQKEQEAEPCEEAVVVFNTCSTIALLVNFLIQLYESKQEH